MKKLLLKCCLLVVLSFAFLPIASTTIGIMLEEFGIDVGVDKETRQMAQEAESRHTAETVILGDSVSFGLWKYTKDEAQGANIVNLARNQATTTCGNYLLMKTYLENNPQTKRVCYIVRAPSLANDMWASAYLHCILPLWNKANAPFIEPETKEMADRRFGKAFVENGMLHILMRYNKKIIKLYTAMVPEQDDVSRMSISRTSVIYLKKMQSLCKQNHIDFYVLPCPLLDCEELHDWNIFEQDVKTYELEDLLGEFAENTQYFPEEWEWTHDGIHLTHEVIEKYGDTIRSNILAPVKDAAG